MRDPASGVFGGLGFFWYVYMIVDSVRVAKAKQAGEPVPDLLGMGLGHPATPVAASAVAPPGNPHAPVAEAPMESGRHMPIGPILLIGLGILFMLNVSDVWVFSWDRTWPLIVIGVGVWMLFSRVGGWRMGYGDQGWRMQTVWSSPARLMGPAMVITTGVLGLLDEYSNWGWGRTWPLYLIVAGAIKMLQFTGTHEDRIEPPAAPPAAPEAESQVTHG
jgi:hypothetical protein